MLAEVSVQHLLDFRSWCRADLLLHYTTALEEQQSRDAADVVPRGRAAVEVHVQLADLRLSGVVSGKGIDCRRHLPAWPTPLSPKIDQHWNVGVQHVLVERRVRKFES